MIKYFIEGNPAFFSKSYTGGVTKFSCVPSPNAGGMDTNVNPTRSKSPNLTSYHTVSNGHSDGYDVNRKETIKQYKRRKLLEKQLNKNGSGRIAPISYTPPLKSSLACLKQEQEEAKRQSQQTHKKKKKRKKKKINEEI